MAKDLVCGMTVDEKTPAATMKFKGATYYFCSQQCVQEFKMDPKAYVEKKEDQGEQQHHHH